eukprot:CAMPEP_0177678494 /NCGR_PEP_ID=MMETSP0447-20121125/29039_1 /TAXON_ID=0 /ORGANISM="Stygamoeba regulata, Strain BSH-02190019" /LENGTH=290 /DNA_ID=CAMNT_0019187501 /DNA_START=104 /DNA_END=973 /DNA_ORIENTATION=-
MVRRHTPTPAAPQCASAQAVEKTLESILVRSRAERAEGVEKGVLHKTRRRLLGLLRANRLREARELIIFLSTDPAIQDQLSYFTELTVEQHIHLSDVDSAIALVHTLHRKGVPVGIRTLNRLLRGVRTLDAARAQGLLDCMLHSFGVPPHHTSYTIVLDGYADCGDAKAALALIHRMTDLKPNVFCLRALLRAMVNAGQLNEAHVQLSGMRARFGIDPDAAMVSIVVRGFLQAGQYASARAVVEDVCSRGERQLLGEEALQALLCADVAEGRLADAVRTLAEWRSADRPP